MGLVRAGLLPQPSLDFFRVHREPSRLLNSSVVHAREVFKAAVQESAQAIVLVHNHPSGSPDPSPEDLAVTGRLADAGRILGIEVVDHVILGSQGFVSLKELGHV